jgi:hypothetical protein
MSKQSEKTTARFANIFRGLTRAYGVYNNGRAKTIREPLDLKRYDQHLNGELGIGVVPINEENECNFAVIDIDINDIDHNELNKQIDFLKIPLITCRSKSGGAHLYTFFNKPAPAGMVRKILAKWAADLGHGSAEVFPKQNNLGPSDVGNWINLPYYSIVNNCIRYMIDESGPATVAKFLKTAEKMAKDNDMTEYGTMDLAPDGMPPCLDYFYHAGAGEGIRNEVLYSFGVFARKADMPDVEDFLMKINYKIIDPPLPAREVKSIVSSVKKANYQYKCKHPAFKAHCNAEVCKKMRFGIDATEGGDYDEHMIGCLTKHMTNPVRWVLDINGMDVEFASDEIMNYMRVRVLTMERANIIAPPMKQESWLLLIKERLEHVKIVAAPDDATVNGDISQVMEEFIQISDRGQNGRDDLVRGIPVRDMIHEFGEQVPVVMFRSSDLLMYIKRRKINLNLTNNVLWMQMRQMGIGHTKIKANGATMQVWYVRTSDDYRTPIIDPISPLLEI